jgi:hypothetical protein
MSSWRISAIVAQEATESIREAPEIARGFAPITFPLGNDRYSSLTAPSRTRLFAAVDRCSR